MVAIDITNKYQEEAHGMIQKVNSCQKIFDCLRVKRKHLPETKECDCVIPIFRDKFEIASPGIFGKLLELSRCNERIWAIEAVKLEGVEVEQALQTERDYKDLEVFTRAVLFALYPLFLATNQQLPYLLPAEIREEEKRFSEVDVEETKTETQNINRVWAREIEAFLTYLSPSSESEYTRAVYLLIKLVLKAIEKDALPCISEMPEKEKEEFFEELEIAIGMKSIYGTIKSI